jgi:hypothetical protein
VCRGGACLARIVKADLSDIHAAVLFEVRPGRVDDGDVVLFIPWTQSKKNNISNISQQRHQQAATNSEG